MASIFHWIDQQKDEQQQEEETASHSRTLSSSLGGDHPPPAVQQGGNGGEERTFQKINSARGIEIDDGGSTNQPIVTNIRTGERKGGKQEEGHHHQGGILSAGGWEEEEEGEVSVYHEAQTEAPLVQESYVTTPTLKKEGMDFFHNEDKEELDFLKKEEMEVLRSLIRSFKGGKNDVFPNDQLTPHEIAQIRSSLHFKTKMAGSSTNSDPTLRRLNRDTFSFMIFDTSIKSMLCAVSVQLLQLIIFCIILVDNRKDRFGVPSQVSGEVKATGFFALIIAVLTQDDLRTSLSMWRDKYHPHIFESAFPGATYKKWFISTLFRAITGFLSLGVTLLLVVQSEDVLELLLNFTAIEVVSRLDDAAFLLAEYYYLGDDTFKDAAMISTTTYRITDDRGIRWFRKGVLLGTFLVMLIIWSVAVGNELSAPPTRAPTMAPTTFASTCLPSEQVIRVEVQTDEFPSETQWSISLQGDELNRALLSGGPYNRGFTTFTEQFCADRDECLEFTIRDSGGDGICCSSTTGNGRFTIFVDDEEVAVGGNFTFSQTVYLGAGTCPCTICEYGFVPISSQDSSAFIADVCFDLIDEASTFNASDSACFAYRVASPYCGCPTYPGITPSSSYCRICGDDGTLLAPFYLDSPSSFVGNTCIQEEVDANAVNSTGSCSESQNLAGSYGCDCVQGPGTAPPL